MSDSKRWKIRRLTASSALDHLPMKVMDTNLIDRPSLTVHCRTCHAIFYFGTPKSCRQEGRLYLSLSLWCASLSHRYFATADLDQKIGHTNTLFTTYYG